MLDSAPVKRATGMLLPQHHGFDMRPAHILLALAIAALWGFNFVVIKVGLATFPPILFSALRFAVAALPLLVLAWRFPPPTAWRYLVAIGLVFGVAKFSLLFIGIDIGMPAGLASLVLQSQAFFTVLFAAVMLGERPSPRQLLGIGTAFAGIGLIASEMPLGGSLAGLGLVVAAAACWGASNLLMKQARPTDMVSLMIWVSAIPPLPLLLLSWWFEGGEAIHAAFQGFSWLSVGVLFYIGVLVTILGFAAWSYLLRLYPASLVAPFSLLVPIFGMSSAALLLGEPLSILKVTAAGLVLVGLLLTVVSLPRPAPVAEG